MSTNMQNRAAVSFAQTSEAISSISAISGQDESSSSFGFQRPMERQVPQRHERKGEALALLNLFTEEPVKSWSANEQEKCQLLLPSPPTSPQVWHTLLTSLHVRLAHLMLSSRIEAPNSAQCVSLRYSMQFTQSSRFDIQNLRNAQVKPPLSRRREIEDLSRQLLQESLHYSTPEQPQETRPVPSRVYTVPSAHDSGCNTTLRLPPVTPQKQAGKEHGPAAPGLENELWRTKEVLN